MNSETYFFVTSDLHATQGQRFLNYLIDFVIQFVISMAFGFFAYYIGELTDFYAVFDWFENMNKIEEYLFGGIIILFYYSLTETLFSRSLAKYITQTIVVKHDGSKPNASEILKRTFCRLIPFDGFSFLNSDARGWHDTISDTYVVRKQEFEKKKDLFYSFEEIGKDQNKEHNEISSYKF